MDGNCLFRAVADQIAGNPELHLIVRNECTDYMLKNSDDFIPFIEDRESIEQYCERMSKLGQWGG